MRRPRRKEGWGTCARAESVAGLTGQEGAALTLSPTLAISRYSTGPFSSLALNCNPHNKGLGKMISDEPLTSSAWKIQSQTDRQDGSVLGSAPAAGGSFGTK